MKAAAAMEEAMERQAFQYPAEQLLIVTTGLRETPQETERQL